MVYLSKIYDVLLPLSFGHCIVSLSKTYDVLLPLSFGHCIFCISKIYDLRKKDHTMAKGKG
jgi:hypothetical protein